METTSSACIFGKNGSGGGPVALLFLLLLSVPVILLQAPTAEGAKRFSYETILSGLTSPVAATDAGDGSGRLFITLQEGRVLVYDGAALLPDPFLDISDLVSFGGEQGLFSIAFHPNYLANGLFYVNYTNLAGNTVVSRYHVSPDPNVADRASVSVLLTVDQPFGNHNGGQLQFGADGYLYIGMGDGGSGGDPLGAGQDLTTLLGKMLRIDVDGPAPYGIPPDNPFVSNPGGRDEIWALGLRNPWRFSFDSLTGDLFIGDVGQSAREEINYQPAGAPGGRNYGWNLMEGRLCFDPPSNCNDGSLTLPVIEYSHATGCSVTGGYRYRGSAIPVLKGAYLFADFCTGQVWGADRQGGATRVVELFDAPFPISSFGQDESGELYILSLQPPASSGLHRITFVEEATLNLVPEAAIVPGGGVLTIRIEAVSAIHSPQELLFSTEVVTPSGASYPPSQPLFGPRKMTLQPFGRRSAELSHQVPGNAPAGHYIYRASLKHVDGGIAAEQEVPFTITAP